MKRAKQVLILSSLLIMAGCGSMSVAPGQDATLVNAQRTATTAHQAFDLLFKVERENEAYVMLKAPSVHAGINAIRRKAQPAEDNLWAAAEVYRKNRTPENKANLETYLATLQTLLEQAHGYKNEIQSHSTP